MSGRSAKLVRRWKPIPNQGVLNALKTTAGKYSSAAKRAYKALNHRERGELRRQVSRAQ